MTFIHFRAKRTHGFPNVLRRRLKALGHGDIRPDLRYRLKDQGLTAIVTGLNMARVEVVYAEAA